MSKHNHIFNRKLLNRRLQNVPDIEKKLTIIKNWKYSIEHSDLSKTKEEAIQGDFLTAFFTDILGYKKRYGNKLWNITQEQKTIVDGTKADGALGFFTDTIHDIRAVIELKDAKTDLDKKQKGRSSKISPVEQAFSYASKSGKQCNWVIVSNFKEIRLYHSSDQSSYEVFYITDLANKEEFKRFYFLLSYENLLNRETKSIIENLYEQNETEQQLITKKFYSDYKKTRLAIFQHLKENNSTIDELVLFEKTQKLLDRFIFICFCEDNNLLPENIFRRVIQVSKLSFDISETKIWTQLKGLFHSIDKGNKSQNINHYNGGLFKEDKILDQLHIKDNLLSQLEYISDYDFASELDVNILGHIFEQSISDIEEIKAEIRGERIDKKESKRKKDGIYYTPGYVTNYIVSETIGGWLSDKRKELGEENLPDLLEFSNDMKGPEKRKYNSTLKKHKDFWTKYSDILANIKVVDPACGSGAFLNAAFDFLYNEGRKVNEILSQLKGGQTSLFDLDKHILKNNLYGVDLNKESVEITKLSLWLKTANKNDTLTSLDENILCGNSVVSDPTFAKDSAFNWNDSFKEIFENGGFDIVIGNPPYVRQEYLVIFKKFLKQQYKTFSGRADLYVYFFEKSFEILKDGGKMGFICSSKYTKANYGSSLRNYLLGHSAIINFLDFGDLEVFEGITAYPSIIISQKEQQETNRNNNEIRYCLFKELTNNISNYIEENSTSFSQSMLTKDEWVFKQAEYMDLSMYLSEKFNRLDALVGNPKVGCKTARNIAFILNTQEANTLISKDPKNKLIIKPYLFGEDVKQYIVSPKQYIIFPYIEQSGKLELVNIEHFPLIKEHLEHFRKELEGRAIIKDGLKKGTKKWYEYQQINKEFSLEKTYITYPNVSNQNNFAISKGNVIDMTAFYIELQENDFYHLAILNSEILNSLFRSISIERRGGFREYKTQYVGKIPYPNINKEQIDCLTGFAFELQDLNAELNESTNDLTSYLEQTYKIKATNKMNKWYEHSYEEILNELKKRKVKIDATESFDLMKLFNKSKNHINTIQQKIAQKKENTNQIVYEAYGLSKQEIELIQNNQ